MKRTVSAFLAICLAFCLLPVAAFAESKSYYLDEVQMSIDIPAEFVVFTRDTDESVLRQYGLSKEKLSAFMDENVMYLDAFDYLLDGKYELFVFMIDQNVVEDMNTVSDDTYTWLKSGILEEFEELGASDIRCEDYQGSKANFLKIYYSILSNGQMFDKLRYVTIKNGKTIAIELISTSGEIEPSQEQLLKEIVDSARFDKAPQTQSKGDNASGKNASEHTQEHGIEMIITAAVILLVIIIAALRKKFVKKARERAEAIAAETDDAAVRPETEAASENETNASEETEPEEKKPQQRYCRKCGFALPEDSNFCSKCGTAVENDEER